MKQLVFATANPNKVKEVSMLLPEGFVIKGLADIGCFEELPETHNTIAANSLEKAEYLHEKYGFDCFSEDTGLEVTALNGAPGVDTAFYSGSRDPQQNMELLLLNLRNQSDRSAQFRTVFTLFIEKKWYQFEGIVTGMIAEKPIGDKGFGYDPIFIPDGATITFGEMEPEQKKAFSHRAKAFNLMTAFLKANFEI
jgi:XTP/dITP diphosphohydrolase